MKLPKCAKTLGIGGWQGFVGGCVWGGGGCGGLSKGRCPTNYLEPFFEAPREHSLLATFNVCLLNAIHAPPKHNVHRSKRRAEQHICMSEGVQRGKLKITKTPIVHVHVPCFGLPSSTSAAVGSGGNGNRAASSTPGARRLFPLRGDA